jgi:hypothetical protein
VLLASVSPVFAQAASASISGTITDAQGGRAARRDAHRPER